MKTRENGSDFNLYLFIGTAHILGGACMGKDSREGVINKDHELFGYKNMYVCDGSAISANIGVNPSLTITATSERAMSKIPAAGRQGDEGVVEVKPIGYD